MATGVNYYSYEDLNNLFLYWPAFSAGDIKQNREWDSEEN